MNYFKVSHKCPLFLFVLLLLIFAAEAGAQDVSHNTPAVEIELDISEQVASAGLLSLAQLGVFDGAEAPVFLTGMVRNLTQETLTSLYFEVKVNSSRRGTVLIISQDRAYPFSLRPQQTIFVNNNNVARNQIPGLQEPLVFNTELTPPGNRLMETLSGSGTLPADMFTVEVRVLRITPESGTEVLSSAVAEAGSVIAPETDDIFLRTPGGAADAEVFEITNPWPQFSWDGSPGNKYRLLVVTDNGEDSPEALLENARSSPPASEGGSLLAFENLDVVVTGNSFRYPVSGVQALEAGKTYYWRVITYVDKGPEKAENLSEIWSFRLVKGAEELPVPGGEETGPLLQALIGEEAYRELINAGFTLNELETEEGSFRGSAAAAKLAEIIRKIEDGLIILGDNK